jgi:Cys-tRNA synthase (O-phospho-L-seryl-tRNA:Cys-tRNA synthase)
MSTKQIISYTDNIQVYKDDLFETDTNAIYLQFTNVKESTILLDSLAQNNSLTLKIDLDEFLEVIENLKEKID